MKKIAVIAALSLGCLASASCATTPEERQQGWFKAKNRFDAALVVAGDYAQLARCETPAKPPCSKEDIVLKLRKARDAALAALDAWENAVFTPGFGEDKLTTARATALSAVDAFVSITKTSEVKKQ